MNRSIIPTTKQVKTFMKFVKRLSWSLYGCILLMKKKLLTPENM